LSTTRTATLTEGCAAVLRLLSPRVPDAFLIAGAVSFGVGVYQLDARAVWLYVGAVCVWLAFGLAANQKPKEPA
jgi:hypothetical protein